VCADAAAATVDLDNPDLAYRGYVTRVRERVRAHVTYPRAAGERREQGDLLVEFRIAPSGLVACAAVRRSSGSDLLDRYVLSAVRLAQPFTALPSHAPSTLAVSATFRFRIDDGPEAGAR
jgi:protein TonB